MTQLGVSIIIPVLYALKNELCPTSLFSLVHTVHFYMSKPSSFIILHMLLERLRDVMLSPSNWFVLFRF